MAGRVSGGLVGIRDRLLFLVGPCVPFVRFLSSCSPWRPVSLPQRPGEPEQPAEVGGDVARSHGVSEPGRNRLLAQAEVGGSFHNGQFVDFSHTGVELADMALALPSTIGLPLNPGYHRLRVAFVFEGVEVASNPVGIEITAAP